MPEPRHPTGRDKYRVAIICALPRESDAMDLLFDHIWDQDGGPDLYGPVTGGNNVYTYGRIRHVNIVLATLPRIGTVSAAVSSAAIRSDFPSLVTGFVVGIYGGVPIIQGRDAFLGDVVVSSSIVRYDYGKQYDGRFSINKTPKTRFDEHQKQTNILKRAAVHLNSLQAAAKDLKRRTSYDTPEADTDRLFSAEYTHKHRAGCAECNMGETSFDIAVLSRCDDIGCDPAFISRPSRTWQGPSLFVRRIGSGNTVMKSAQDRDRLAKQEEIIAFEMESAGAWEELPCLIVKGICDCSDSHKNKDWQDFASATAASVARALIERMAMGSSQGLLEGPTSGNDWGNNFGHGANFNTGTIFGNGSWTSGKREIPVGYSVSRDFIWLLVLALGANM
ncbi:nucleoside phosphorylase domain-containing protein [Plectosphaerella plurivora]|uniref:Nucleoside phosphorylase domain-containing protein n=1 Tax=Plectosphaerella plurivora TaxID=936078 RepID=A0A9P8V2I6_9PEZI|nr:nucleoside phosphorylase domain-containing protein [Plectosphaerella plurivora]